MSAFETARQNAVNQVTALMDTVLHTPDGPERRLVEAMRYAALDGGKGFRPFLAVATAKMFDVDEAQAVRAAMAVECVHCYSLIHDDLPAMDDDDMRRGRPSLHKAYDEATAILAGDALLTLAFEILADEKIHNDATVRADLVTRLAQAAGMQGMVGGQMMDLLSPDLKLDAGGLTRLQKMKTGALISCAVEAGALLGQADDAQHHALVNYAHDIGLAFQIADDVLDVEGASADIGKTAGKDAASGKVTFASLLGVERARAQAASLIDQAVNHLDIFGPEADVLRQAAKFVIQRQT
ncbi:MAG: polyprenyl synthetase family protein [Parvibaculales bacterium]